MKNISSLVIIIVFIIILILVLKKEIWSGYFYPDRNNLSEWLESDSKFNSLEECRNWAQNKALDLKLNKAQYDYECGLNCKYKDGVKICKETLN